MLLGGAGKVKNESVPDHGYERDVIPCMKVYAITVYWLDFVCRFYTIKSEISVGLQHLFACSVQSV